MGAALVLLLTPGPAVLYIIARSVEQGRLAGVISAIGMATGTLFHIAATALGLSALILSSVLAFNILKYAGAVYLIYLGIRKLFFREEPPEPDRKEGKELKQIFYQAVVVNIFNPKTALFFIAFLPQFINPSKGSIVGQILFFGILLVVMGLCSDSLYALLAGSARGLFKGKISNTPRFISGSVYLALGVVTAFTSVNQK